MLDPIETIRAALADDASPEARTAGAAACRAILGALEASPGEQMATATPINTSQIAGIVGALRGVPPEQLLDLAIAKLRSALPADATVPPVTPLKFHILPIPPIGGAR
jgi:hypothetical protein